MNVLYNNVFYILPEWSLLAVYKNGDLLVF
jgi:hypothetical protein